MKIGFETLSILAFLIPGFLSSLILDHAVFRKPRDTAGTIIEALIFSFIIYVILAAVSGKSPVTLAEHKVGDAKEYSIQFQASMMIWLLILSFVLPLLMAFCINNDLTTGILRKLRISHGTSRASTWLDVLSSEERYIIVNFVDGRRLHGWPMYYANSPDEACLYVYNPAWIDGSHYVELNIHGLFLVKKDLIETIEFTNVTRQIATNKPDEQKNAPAAAT
jgi:Family of unknown function (DUF6338)